MKLFLCGGGTGGHVYPAVAIAEHVLRERRGVEPVFVGMADSFESRAVAARGWKFIAMPAAPLKGKSALHRLRSIWTLTGAFRKAWAILRRERPDGVIGTGGYVSGPLLFMAALLRIPTVIHEQNSVPGLTNRILGRFVDRVCVTYAHSSQYFPAEKVVETGLPLRQTVMEQCEKRAQAEADSRAMILVMGGSQGARRLNQVMQELCALPAFSSLSLRVVHLAGQRADLEALRAAYAQTTVPAEVLAFTDNIGELYAQATLAICRAGASSVAELALAGVPAVFVPFPYAADDHQTMNAQALVDLQAACLIPETALNAENLYDLLATMLRDQEQLTAMRNAMLDWARPDAARAVVDVCNDVMCPMERVQHV